MTPPRSTAPRVLRSALVTFCVAGVLIGCRGERSDKPPHQFLPDMDDSPKMKPQAETEFFADGRSMRPRVAGTVAFGHDADASGADRSDFLRDDPEVYFGRDDENDFINTIPDAITVDRDFLLRGQERYRIYCFVCHGYSGEGGSPAGETTDASGGIVGRRWSYAVPSFHDPKYADTALRTGKDGYLFDVVRHGVWDDQVNHTGSQRMPGYRHAIGAHDAWAIVAYLRALQASRVGPDEVDGPLPANRPQADSAGTISMAEEGDQ